MVSSLFGEKKLEFDPALGDRLGKVILKEVTQGKFEALFREVARLRQGGGVTNQRGQSGRRP
jgi:hypothetical protein